MLHAGCTSVRPEKEVASVTGNTSFAKKIRRDENSRQTQKRQLLKALKKLL